MENSESLPTEKLPNGVLVTPTPDLYNKFHVMFHPEHQTSLVFWNPDEHPYIRIPPGVFILDISTPCTLMTNSYMNYLKECARTKFCADSATMVHNLKPSRCGLRSPLLPQINTWD